jgi:ATP-dependent helicase STH1/SNF2
VPDFLQAKAFEQNDEDEEDTKELDDDELNQLLARGEFEEEIFKRMDQEREAAKVSSWRAKGKTGPVPPPLMEESELPPFYRRDIGDELRTDLPNDEDQGRGRRAKNEVKYTDGLTDEQWLNAVDASDDDLDDAMDRKKVRVDKKAERKRMNEMLAKAEAEGKPLSAVKLEVGSVTGSSSRGGASTPATGGKKARPSISATPSVLGDDGPPVSRECQTVSTANGGCRNAEKRKHLQRQNRPSCGGCSMLQMPRSLISARISTCSSSNPSTRR